MKICYWNCNGAFRKKYTELLKEKADLYIVSEVEDISKIDFLENISNKLYCKTKGDIKGVLFFSFDSSPIIPVENDNYGIRYVIPVKFKNIKIFGIWAKGGYIEDLYTYSAINIDQMKNSILIGDFNSNVIWDKKHGERCHTNFDAMLKKINLISGYHTKTHEKLGHENKHTFYMYRKVDKGYYIDYVYLPDDYEYDFGISDKDVLQYSDHMIISLDIIKKGL
ncbi:endonuclease/exonuclease/phosphatase family protein [Apilactobacillus kunkeei]|uniref:Endonuclease/exonuclease/phosphatase domain-containing protein n=1 Tax=Apilactobacillus kunkeei TaxID=148814 RepID=A0A0M9DDU9_9LACO|nr:endonuclease/exonuclease/phosphatase family protein [Apilactobacillus kunkeei]KOY79412.1 uncharacterized protein RZ72_10220 [Apilactobacillus kunkeei]